MSCIYENQPLKLETTITVDGASPPNPVTAADYDYWIPTNFTNTPTGTWRATIDNGTTGDISYEIAADVLTPAGEWKVQANATSGGLEYPACMDTFTVKALGS